MDEIKFTVNEQNCLAMVCQLLSSASHRLLTMGEPLMASHVEELEDILERFPHTNWGDLYDKFHRQGMNR